MLLCLRGGSHQEVCMENTEENSPNLSFFYCRNIGMVALFFPIGSCWCNKEAGIEQSKKLTIALISFPVRDCLLSFPRENELQPLIQPFCCWHRVRAQSMLLAYMNEGEKSTIYMIWETVEREKGIACLPLLTSQGDDDKIRLLTKDTLKAPTLLASSVNVYSLVLTVVKKEGSGTDRYGSRGDKPSFPASILRQRLSKLCTSCLSGIFSWHMPSNSV